MLPASWVNVNRLRFRKDRFTTIERVGRYRHRDKDPFAPVVRTDQLPVFLKLGFVRGLFGNRFFPARGGFLRAVTTSYEERQSKKANKTISHGCLHTVTNVLPAHRWPGKYESPTPRGALTLLLERIARQYEILPERMAAETRRHAVAGSHDVRSVIYVGRFVPEPTLTVRAIGLGFHQDDFSGLQFAIKDSEQFPVRQLQY